MVVPDKMELRLKKSWSFPLFCEFIKLLTDDENICINKIMIQIEAKF